MSDRFGVRVDTRTVSLLSGVGVIAAITGGVFGVAQMWAPVIVATLLLAVITYRSRTLASWIKRRATYRRVRRDANTVYDYNNVGVVWDGETAHCYIELLPNPYEVTVLRDSNDSPDRAIPVEALRDTLTQFDIQCAALSVITTGYKFVSATDVANVYHATVGPVQSLLYGRTVIEVSIHLGRSLQSVKTRGGDDPTIVGLNRTVSIAAERIRRRLARLRWSAVLLTDQEISQLHDEIAASVEPTLEQENWGSCGPATISSIAYTPASAAWGDENLREWLKINTSRHMHVVRLSRSKNADSAHMYVAYVTTDPASLNTARALGLLREHSQQGDILTSVLPLTRTVAPTAVKGKNLGTNPFPMCLYSGGVGTYLGLTDNRAQVFVNFANGANELFYVIAPVMLLQQLLLRLSTSGLSIDIDIPGDHWSDFADKIGVTQQQNPMANVVVSTDELLPATHANQVRIVWTTTQPRGAVRHAIIADNDKCLLRTPYQDDIKYEWVVSTAEKAYFTVDEQSALSSV